jgi:hypothetical protein
MRKLVTLLLGVALVAAPGSASAHDHKPPNVALRSEGVRQPAVRGSSCWTRANDNGSYTADCLDYERPFPAATRMRAGALGRVRIRKTTAPEELTLTSWRKAGKDGFAKVEGEDVTYTLEPRLDDDGNVVAYDAVFPMPLDAGDFYLHAFGIWAEEEGGGGHQDAEYLMHAELVDAL